MREITYSRNGDYLIPDIKLEETRGTIGKYGMMRKEYLRNHKKARFSILGTAEQAGQPSDGSGQRSQTESGRPDHAASGERPGTGEISRQHGMDPSHEPDPGTGRGTGGSGDYIQLSLFPTEEEQFGRDSGKAAAALIQPAAFFVSDEIVDDVLRTGSGRKNTLFHITAKLVEGIDHEELRSFLIQEYGTGGKGF